MRFSYEHHPYGKPGWRIQFRPFKRGAGYMAYTFPWLSRSIHSPRWRRRAWVSYVPGYTLTIGTHQREIHSRKSRRVYVCWTKKGNTKKQSVPSWW